MIKKLISEASAKAGIFLLFAVTLLVFILFWWSARSYKALEPLAEEAGKFPSQLLLLTQVEKLELQLEKARDDTALAEKQAEQAEKQGADAQKEADRLTSTRVELLDSLTLDYSGEYYATAYCCEVYPHICGGNGRTASGTVPTPGLTVAADWGVFPSGTWLYIEGVGMRRVEDTGSAIKGKRLDVAIDTHANALRWSGQGNHHVWVMSWE